MKILTMVLSAVFCANLAATHLLVKTTIPSGSKQDQQIDRHLADGYLSYDRFSAYGNMQNENLAELYSRNDSLLGAGFTLFNITLLGGVYHFQEALNEINYKEEFTSLTGGISVRTESFLLFTVIDQNGNFMGKAGFFLNFSTPIELELGYRRLYKEEISYQLKTFIHLKHNYGFGAGYDTLTDKPLAVIFYSFTDSVRITIETQFPSKINPGTITSVALTFTPEQKVSPYDHHNFVKKSYASNKPNLDDIPTKPKTLPGKKKEVPGFATLVRWGIQPTEALQLVRTRDICSAPNHVRDILAEKNWECYP